MRRRYLLSGGPQYSSSANVRAASSPGGLARSPPSEAARCRSCSRWRAVNSKARRRLRLNAAGSWRASNSAKSALPSASTVAGSIARTLIVCPPPSSSAISPTISPGPALPISTTRPPGACSDAATAPSTMNNSSRASSPWCQSVSPAGTARRRSTRARSAISGSFRPASSGTVARKSTVARSDIQVACLELEAGRGELGRQHRVLRNLEPARVIGGERLGGDDHRAGRIARRHLPVAVALRVLAADRVPEAHEREVGLEHLVLRRVPAVVEREAGGDKGAAGAEAQVDRRRGVDAEGGADAAQDAKRLSGCVRELARLRDAIRIVQLRHDQRVDPFGVRGALDVLRELGSHVVDERIAHARELAQVPVVRERNARAGELERMQVRVGDDGLVGVGDAANVRDQTGWRQLGR